MNQYQAKVKHGHKSSLSIGEVVRNAVLFNGRNGRTRVMESDSLLQDVGRLFELLHERDISYVLVGGVALLQYIDGRNTEDVDLIMSPADVKAIPEIEIATQEGEFARGYLGGLQIDLLLTRNKLFDTVRREYTAPQSFVEREIMCATVPGLLLLKLYALPSLYRQGDFARVGIYENDIALLMHAHRPQMAPIWTELQSNLSTSDLTAVQKIVSEIEARIDRFGSTFGDE